MRNLPVQRGCGALGVGSRRHWRQDPLAPGAAEACPPRTRVALALSPLDLRHRRLSAEMAKGVRKLCMPSPRVGRGRG